MLLNQFGQFFKGIFVIDRVYREVFGMFGIHFKIQAIITLKYDKCCKSSTFVSIVEGMVCLSDLNNAAAFSKVVW